MMLYHYSDHNIGDQNYSKDLFRHYSVLNKIKQTVLYIVMVA